MPAQTVEKQQTSKSAAMSDRAKPQAKADTSRNAKKTARNAKASAKSAKAQAAVPNTAAKKTKPQTKLANGRVSAAVLEDASKVLERNGLTVSAFIRNSLNYVATTGEVPESGQTAREKTPADRLKELSDFFKKIDAEPMPGKADYPGLTDDEMVERIRMERYGY